MRKRILIVDDDRAMVDTLCDILEFRGWTTLRAYDGITATQVALSGDVDIVLMDVRMPGIDGTAALQQIKTRRPELRVILMTAYAAQDLLEQAERDGALRILRKPVEIGELLLLLDSATARVKSVLIVDDDPEALRTLSDVLTRHGLVTSLARTLGEALARLDASPPAAVLLDLKLNGVDSSEHLIAIRDMNPSALLVLYSGHDADLADAVERMPNGLIAAAFTKPLPIERLLELIDGDVQR